MSTFVFRVWRRLWSVLPSARALVAPRAALAVARLCIAAATAVSAAALAAAAVAFHVSPLGRDTNDGLTSDTAFATLARARDAVRALKAGPTGLPAGGVTVWLHHSYFDLSATLSFDARDSGTATAPIVWAAAPGTIPCITGGRSLSPFQNVRVDASHPAWSRLDPAARGQVFVTDLRAQGIADFGTLRPRGFGLSAAAPLELFCNGRPMLLAQWPNRGEPLVRTVAAASDRVFTYAGTRPERWLQADALWLHGFWGETWADFHVPAARIDPVAKTITLASAPGTYGIKADRLYYAYNLLEELDAPGEYYLDRTSGLLYFWPPNSAQGLSGAELQISLLEAPLVQITGTQYVTFRDLILENTRGSLVRIDSGDHLRFERCLLRNAGQSAAIVAGSANGFDHCEFVDCGEAGAKLSGGARASLTRGDNYVANSRLHRLSRLTWTYQPAISLAGCGHRAAHNLIEDLPHSAILFSGNEHRIEANEIRRVCQATSDCGAIYTGRDWGYRGNVVRHNFIHHIASWQEGFGVHGMYLDDCVSGPEVSGNVFHRITGSGIMAGGGRDLVLRGNLISACGNGHRNDDRGRTRITNTTGDSWNLLARLAAEGIRYQQPPWSTAYPACAAIPNSWEAVQQGLWRNPENCVFTANAGWGNTTWLSESNPSGTGVFKVYAVLADNEAKHAPLFGDDAAFDRALRPASLRANLPGFTDIPFASIGRDWSGQPAATQPPPAPILDGALVGAGGVSLHWTDDANLARNRETGFVLERRNLPDGAWQRIATYGPDAGLTMLEGLAPATTYAFRIQILNTIGSAASNVLQFTTPALPWLAGSAARVEAEAAYAVVVEAGSLGTIGVSNASLDSGQSVRLYDPGDTVRLSFSVATEGTYRLGVRLRSGGGGSPTSYWPRGYRFRLDGADLAFVGDAASLSAFDSGYGGAYWGTMTADVPALTAGLHTLEVTASSSWGVVDCLDVARLSPRPIVTFEEWRAAHFSADQLADATISGPTASPVGDGVSNQRRFALGLDPWTNAPATVERDVPVERPAGLENLSCRAELRTPGQSISLGFIVRGPGSRRVLVRAVGPGLAAFGLGDACLRDPKLQVYRGESLPYENDDWEHSGIVAFAPFDLAAYRATLVDAFRQSGAFALPAGSRDAAMIVTLNEGLYTLRVSGKGTDTGTVLAEVYVLPSEP